MITLNPIIVGISAELEAPIFEIQVDFIIEPIDIQVSFFPIISMGKDGLTPYIGENNNWWIGDIDTGNRAIGIDGIDGIDGGDGKSTYQSYLDTTTDEPPLSEADWVESIRGIKEPLNKVTIFKKDASYELDWLKVSVGTTVNNKVITIRRASLKTGHGIEELDIVVNYPAAKTYSGSNIYTGFYIMDKHGRLSNYHDWEYLLLDYDITNDTVNKYSTLVDEPGINVISSHRRDNLPYDTGNEYHAMIMRTVFTAVYPDFKGEYIDTYIDGESNYGDPSESFEPTYYGNKKACIVMKPYSYASSQENTAANPNFLEVGSHGYNTPLRSDLTTKATDFLQNSIAVGAKKENDWQTAPQTTYGYGMEFFEITETSYLEANYPEKGDRIYPSPAAQLWSDEARTKIWTEYANHVIYFERAEIGDKVFINDDLPAPDFGSTHGATWDMYYNRASTKSTVVDKTEVDGVIYLHLDNPIYPTQLTGNKYLWAFQSVAYTAGNTGGSTQSPATMIVGAKFSKLRCITGLNFSIIRKACRETAVLNNGITTTTSVCNTSMTSISVISTSEFPSEGVIKLGDYRFRYTSKTETEFICPDAQYVIAPIGTQVKLYWDIYRGFGQIDLNTALQYLLDNYVNNPSFKNTLQRVRLNPSLEYSDLGNNDCIAKRNLETINMELNQKLSSLEIKIQEATDIAYAAL